uniref:Scu_1 protein n=1 Tax=Fopius arisanus TaxID=64838 RepID=A0A0C9REC8_9HYME
MKTDVKNVVAFITGGASGIGKAVAEMIIAHGGQVVLADIDDETGKAVVEEMGPNALYVHADVLSEDEIRKALQITQSEFGKINVLINSAAILGGEHFYDYATNTPHPLESCREIMEVNTIGVFNVMRLATSIMMEAPADEDEQRGVIINLSSIAGYGVTDRIVYGASKAAVNAMTEPVARWLAPVGIRCVGIAPGVVDTPMIGTDFTPVFSVFFIIFN